MKNIVFIHQSADLYGSDKAILYLIENIKNEFNAIVVVPKEGPLTSELKKRGVRVIIIPVLKVSRQIVTSLQILALPFLIFSAMRKLKKELGTTKIDIIQSNTLAVFLGAFYSKKNKIKHIWHVHEIIKHPTIVAKIYPYLVNFFSQSVVFNSEASFNNLCKNNSKLINKAKVIYNGLDRDVPIISVDEKMIMRRNMFKSINNDTIILGVVGRINKYKGHTLLLNVFEELVKEGFENIKLIYIGSTIKSQSFLKDKLIEVIENKELKHHVKIIPFQSEIWKYYDCIDIVLVPTTSIESFGLVALEGMLSKKPVIASENGGLKEVIANNHSGFLFETNNSKALKEAIKKLLLNKELIINLGEQGEERAKLKFPLKNYINKFKELYNSF